MGESVLSEKYERLLALLRESGSVAVAFSAGVDSTLLLKAAVDALGGSKVVAVTGDSASVPREELEHAQELASFLGVEHVMLQTDEFEKSEYLANPTNRCYHCKTTLFEHMRAFVAERGIATIASGVNADDFGDFRPGIQAGRENGVRLPLAEAGLTKEDLRALSLALGLPTYDKPASPCLSSRVPYGEPITREKLAMIEEAERFLHSLGVRECRVRHHLSAAMPVGKQSGHGTNIARIEVAPEWFPRLAEPDMARLIDEQFKSLGYQYVCLDLRGFRSGSLNEVITIGNRTSD